MTDAELKSYLFADRLEQAELEQVMLGHFGRATGEGKDMLYFREGTEDKLRIVYTNKHAIRGIALSPGYPESELQALRHRIHTELVEDQETKVAQVICFAYTRLTGYVRGCLRGIHFQMLPLPPGNTSVGFEHGRHPFVLEVTYQTSVNPMIRFGRIQRATTAVARFLNLLLASPIETGPRSADHVWVVDAQESDGKVVTTNRYLQLGYFPEGLSQSMTEFSDASGVPPMPRIPGVEYYSKPGIALGPLPLPDSFEQSLDTASQLSTTSYDKLSIATTFFAISHGVWLNSRSASYASLVAVIEALLPEEKYEHCRECGQPVYRISERFRDFLTHYAPGQQQARERKALQDAFYELRSGLAHGRKILQSDLAPWKFLGRQGWIEDELHRTLQQVVRTATLNWLWAQNPCISSNKATPRPSTPRGSDNGLKRLARKVCSLFFPATEITSANSGRSSLLFSKHASMFRCGIIKNTFGIAPKL